VVLNAARRSQVPYQHTLVHAFAVVNTYHWYMSFQGGDSVSANGREGPRTRGSGPRTSRQRPRTESWSWDQARKSQAHKLVLGLYRQVPGPHAQVPGPPRTKCGPGLCPPAVSVIQAIPGLPFPKFLRVCQTSTTLPGRQEQCRFPPRSITKRLRFAPRALNGTRQIWLMVAASLSVSIVATSERSR
jgi:hypothetical protein